MIEVAGLTKRYGELLAVDDVSFTVARGEVFGLLGPNGAGKTTTIDCLTTLIRPDGGRATVAGHDLAADPAGVRASLALTGQFAALDEQLTARENLVLFGRLAGLSRRDARERATTLAGMLSLSEFVDRRVKTLSGGMRRRLDLAVSLVRQRPVLLLDEPTTGLDPRSRTELWGVVDGLRDAGVTVLLTTQYLEEADRLADRLAVVDHGRVIATGTPDELKQRVAGTVCDVAVDDPARRDDARETLTRAGMDVRDGDSEAGLSVAAPEQARTLAAVARLLDDAGIEVADIGLRRPSLDDVFFALTGQPATTDPPTTGVATTRTQDAP